jgi:pyruvate kinase
VANAIYDSTSAVMLSGETAVGKYPVETVKMMSKIIEEAEEDFDHQHHIVAQNEFASSDVTSCVAMATVKTATSSGAQAIFCVTDSGRTAKLIASYRPNMKILASTRDEKVYHQLALCWGIEPVLTGPSKTMEEAFKKLSLYSMERGWTEEGDLVLMTSGNPFGVTGMTNVMLVDCIGDVFLRAQKGFGSRVQAQITHWNEGSSCESVKDRILVIHQFSPNMEKFLREVKGVILDNFLEDLQSEDELLSCCARLAIPVVVRAQGAKDRLPEGTWVKLDPSRAFVFHAKALQK